MVVSINASATTLPLVVVSSPSIFTAALAIFRFSTLNPSGMKERIFPLCLMRLSSAMSLWAVIFAVLPTLMWARSSMLIMSSTVFLRSGSKLEEPSSLDEKCIRFPKASPMVAMPCTDSARTFCAVTFPVMLICAPLSSRFMLGALRSATLIVSSSSRVSFASSTTLLKNGLLAALNTMLSRFLTFVLNT